VNTFDVAIVGGGVIGTSIAFELAAEKLNVVLLDRQQPGREASWAAAGMLSPAPDSPRDIPLVPLSKESLRIYPGFVAAMEEASGQPTGYARGAALHIFFGPQADAERNDMVAEHKRLGLATEPISLEEARHEESAIGHTACAAARLPEEGTIEPRRLMETALAAARNRGVEVRADCGVSELLCERSRCTGVVAGGEKIAAKQVVVAAGCFSAAIDKKRDLLAGCARTRPVRGQMMALRPAAMKLRRVLRSERGYLVPRADGRVVAGSTIEETGFEKRVTPAGLQQILGGVLALCPGLADAEILETWSGLRPGTPDDLPILGPTRVEGLIAATGHYRNGILLSAVTAKLVREWVAHGRTTFDAEAYSPLRFGERDRETGSSKGTFAAS
jgi:glycine oxidase